MAAEQGQGPEGLQGLRRQLCGQEGHERLPASYVHCGGHGDFNCEAELQLRIDMADAYNSTHSFQDCLPKIMHGVAENANDEPGREFPFNAFITEIGVVRHACDTFLKHARPEG